MGDYSLEPPRRDVVFHYTFDAISDDDKVIDIGPQANDGGIQGTVDTAEVLGINGEGALFYDDQTGYVEVQDDIGDTTSLTVSVWVNLEYGVATASNNVLFNLGLDSGDETLKWQFPSELSGWNYFAATFDGNTMILYHGEPGEQPRSVKQKSVTGTIETDFSLDIDIQHEAVMDSPRVYNKTLTQSQIADIWEMESSSVLADELGEVWKSPGMPYIEGLGNARLGSTLAEQTARAFRDLDYTREARHIDDANGTQLDKIGAVAGVTRRDGEADGPYRARIKATVIAGRSSGTFDDIVNGLATVLETDIESVELQLQAPGVARAFIDSNDLSNANITGTDLANAADDMVLAGHRIGVVESQDNPFTLKQDGDTDDADLGLTSDSISTGGALISDL